jgi:hypothetical protein
VILVVFSVVVYSVDEVVPSEAASEGARSSSSDCNPGDRKRKARWVLEALRYAVIYIHIPPDDKTDKPAFSSAHHGTWYLNSSRTTYRLASQRTMIVLDSLATTNNPPRRTANSHAAAEIIDPGVCLFAQTA